MKKLLVLPFLIFCLSLTAQTVRTKSYFQSRFISAYKLTAVDMRDVIESVPSLNTQTITTAISSTFAIATLGIPFTRIVPVSGSTLIAITVSSSDLIVGGELLFYYQKTTATDLVITFPAGTTGTDQNGNELATTSATLTSGITGIFVIRLTRLGASLYTLSIKRDKA